MPTPETSRALGSCSRRPTYQPTALVGKSPVAKLDFDGTGAYSVYNWELFFHVPLTIAIHLSKNGRFEDAQRWFHFVFDPTDDSDGDTPERFWKTAPLRTTVVDSIEDLLRKTSSLDPEVRADFEASIAAWAASPFRPHRGGGLPAVRVHGPHGDGLSRQPDRLG